MREHLRELLLDSAEHQWVPSYPPPKNVWNSDWPYAPVFMDFNYPAVLEELKRIEEFFVPHRENDKVSGYGHEGWSALTLHGIDYDKTEGYERYGFNSDEEANYKWTRPSHLAPNITGLVKKMPFNHYHRVRIMRLAPGGHIMPHTDGPGRIFGPLNFPLTNPEGCKFAFEEDGIVPFEVGRGFMLDLGRRHFVLNDSKEYRYHLIVHGIYSVEIGRLLYHSLEKLMMGTAV